MDWGMTPDYGISGMSSDWKKRAHKEFTEEEYRDHGEYGKISDRKSQFCRALEVAPLIRFHA